MRKSTAKSLSLSVFSLLLLCGSVMCLTAAEPKKTAAKKPTAKTELAKPPALVGAVEEEKPLSRLVRYGERDVVKVNAKLRYTTLIILPEEEKILDFTCGDKEFWAVDGSQNFAYIKPAKAGSRTNVNLITASGNVYSFVLAEVSAVLGVEPDLKVFVEPKETSMISAMNGAPRFVPAAEIEDYRRQAAMAKDEAREIKKEAERLIEHRIDRFRSEYPTELKFDYRFAVNQKPFMVSAMYHDERFTYIRASPQETPALYETKDGKPNLVNFDFQNGAYVVGKILDSGYLAIGKQKMRFERKE